MTQLSIYDSLFTLIDPNTTILTPNRRLAATLHNLYQEHQLTNGLSVWMTPDILPLMSWHQRLWQDYSSAHITKTPLIFNSFQEKVLWETIIIKSKSHEQLLRTAETADKVSTAYALLKQWNIDLTSDSEFKSLFQSAEDYVAVYDWIKEFDSLLEKKNSRTLAELPNLLRDVIAQQAITLPKNLILVGFTDLSPQLVEFMDTCKAQGTLITEYILPHNKNITTRLTAADRENEIYLIAQWAKHLHSQHPTARIGCVIPDVEKIRDRVQQIFSDVFADDGFLQASNNLFNITAGKQLQQYPIINTALQLLSLNRKNIPLEVISHLLFSPFIGEAEAEQIKRAKFDKFLRQSNIKKLNLQQSTQENQEGALRITSFCPNLAKRIQKFYKVLADTNKTATYSTWANLFNKLLNAFGWPGERSLNSEEFQVVDSWLNLFTTFASLDFVSEPVNYHQALQALQKLTATTVFQPKTPDAKIQAMGLLEAAALPFDHLWIAGMDDITWPPQPQPHPFIPKKLQREKQMPHATGERELRFCNTLMEQFATCSPNVIYSYAENNDDMELQPSALIRHYPTLTPSNLNIPETTLPHQKIYQSKDVEWLQDDVAPPLKENEIVRGGINVIQHQALCPFRSFARWRLHAQELETPVPGLRAKDRGTIIHKIMELIWNQLQDHRTLLATSDEELQALVEQSVRTAILSSPPSHSDFKQYLALEKKRLENLILDWLDNEKNRTPFKVITHEKRVDFIFENLNLSFRIDRIDALEDGKQFIIDYKTGKNNDMNSWFSERPEQPQLPLYALIEPQETVGIAFAQIATGDICFKGVSRYAMEVKGVKIISEMKKATALSWDEQLNQWQNVLKKLSVDFSLGIAHVDPKEAEQTCQWCALKSLCRISEEPWN